MLILNRYLSNLTITRGVLIYEGVPLCHTLELPYLDNQQFISSVPPGFYNIHKSTSSLHGRCLRFSYVPNRTGVLIHPGNDLSKTKGCILPGLDVSKTGVIYSVKAMQRLLTELPDALPLQIKDVF